MDKIKPAEHFRDAGRRGYLTGLSRNQKWQAPPADHDSRLIPLKPVVALNQLGLSFAPPCGKATETPNEQFAGGVLVDSAPEIHRRPHAVRKLLGNKTWVGEKEVEKLRSDDQILHPGQIFMDLTAVDVAQIFVNFRAA